jgi:hypothetical protein
MFLCLLVVFQHIFYMKLSTVMWVESISECAFMYKYMRYANKTAVFCAFFTNVPLCHCKIGKKIGSLAFTFEPTWKSKGK